MIGYVLATTIGLSLGLLGGGGSILTVPILVYAMHMDAKLAIALSLAIVGSTSLIGVYGHYKNNNIDFKIATIFGPIAMLGSFIGARLSTFLSGQSQLLIFAIIMIMASVFMLKKKNYQEKEVDKKINLPIISLQAIIVGMITGIVGVGGGFLIVPALVFFAKVPMKKAVGTSLLIISLNSFSGFIGHVGIIVIPWEFLAKFIFFSGSGILIGTNLVQYISQEKLKKAFGYFLIIMGIFILYKNRAIIF